MRTPRSTLLAAFLFLATAPGLFADSLDQWQVRTSGTGDNLYSIAYGSGRFVAVGQAGTILTSTNGAEWEPSTNGTTSSLYGVAWGQDLFVVVGDGGIILTSTDAATWTPQTSPTTNNLKAVRWVADEFMAVGSNGTLLASTNGLSWTALDSGSALTLQGVAFGNGTFCAVGGGNTQNASVTLSPDGITWSNRTLSLNYLYDVDFGNGVFVIQGIRGIVWVSPGGVDWTQVNAGGGTYLFGATFAQGLFVAVGGPYSGGGQMIATSPNGTNWTIRPVTTMLSPPLRAITYGNGFFVAVGGKGIILQSGPVFRLTMDDHLAGGGIEWKLTGEAGRNYRFQYSDLPGDSGWMDVTNFTSADETTLLSDPGAGTSAVRFYRVVSP